MNATEMSMTRIPKSLQLAAFGQQVLDDKRVWRSRKHITSEPQPRTVAHKVATSTAHLAIHQQKPCHRRVFLEATHPPIQMRRNSTCFTTQVLGQLSIQLSTQCSAISAEVDSWRVTQQFVDSRNAPTPVNSHFLCWILAQILLLGVSAVKHDAPPGLISGSPNFLFFKPTSGSGTISS